MATAKTAQRDIIEVIVTELRKKREQLGQIRNGQIIVHVAADNAREPVKLEAHIKLS